MKALIDGDVFVYQCGFAAEKKHYSICLPNGEEIKADDGRHANKLMKEYGEGAERIVEHEVRPLSHALQNVRTKLERTLEATRASTFELFLTGEGNFRETLVDDYKANREGMPKPVHYAKMKEYMINKLAATTILWQEADDAMAIEQMTAHYPTTICTIDKDLKMIPGDHYNFDTDEKFSVTPLDGIRFFYTQLITGDSTDNISGLYKVTDRKCKKEFLEPIQVMEDELSMWEYVKSVYADDITEEDLIIKGQLLWMRRAEEQMWRPPTEVTYYER